MVEGISQDLVAVVIDKASVNCSSDQTQSSPDIPQQHNQNSLVVDQDWVYSIETSRRDRKLKKGSIVDSCSISRVSAAFKESDGASFKPRTISIGPVHNNTLDDEDHKWSYLDNLLNRLGEGSSMKFLVGLTEIEKETRECYKTDTNVNKFDSKSFLQMMLLDGCFVIELFFKAMDKKYDNDPLLVSEWTRKNVARDLILLENQIPFLVLRCLFDQMNVSCNKPSLAEMALSFFEKSLNIRYSYDEKFHPQHLLHLLHHCCFPLSAEIERTNSDEKGKTKNFGGTIPSASQLKHAGITFEKDNKYLFDIQFQNGVLKISHFVLDDHACSLFRNLLAFEQCYRDCNKNMMIYIHFMECLIDSPGDFEILTRREIICNNLGTDKVVIKFFKHLVNQVALCDKNDYLKDVRCNINQYYNTIFRRWRASLARIFQKNPWAVVSVAVAITLQLLTLLQRIYMPK